MLYPMLNLNYFISFNLCLFMEIKNLILIKILHCHLTDLYHLYFKLLYIKVYLFF